jgi:predicted metal-dependent phosphoesterase TrpH
MLVDLHAKSSLSDDVDVSPDQVLKTANDAGLDGVAFCDTQSTAYAERLVEAGDNHDINVFIGVEIKTDTGRLLGFAPKIDDFYLDEEWRRYTDYVLPTPDAVCNMFDERGGAVIAARPYDRSVDFTMGDHIFELDGLTGVEVLNSRLDQSQNNFAVEAATYMGIPTVGGSDAPNLDGSVGRYATYFDQTFSSQSEFVEILRSTDYWATELTD